MHIYASVSRRWHSKQKDMSMRPSPKAEPQAYTAAAYGGGYPTNMIFPSPASVAGHSMFPHSYAAAAPYMMQPPTTAQGFMQLPNGMMMDPSTGTSWSFIPWNNEGSTRMNTALMTGSSAAFGTGLIAGVGGAALRYATDDKPYKP
jgi:hypothetical protein